MGRMIGCAMDKKKNILVVSTEAYKKEVFEVIATREIMALYLRDLIVLYQDIEGEIVYWYDLALLFTNYYLKNEKNEYIRNIMEKTTVSFLNFADGIKFYFSEKVVEILKKNTKIYGTKEVNTLFSNIFSCLKILNKYKISLRYKEFANLFFDLCDLFLIEDENSLDFSKPVLKSDYYFFHFRHFQKTLEMNMESKKDSFLVLMFSLLSQNCLEVKSLSDLLQNIDSFIQDQIIQKDIINFSKLIDDAIVEYIFNKIIKIEINHELKKKTLELQVNITNASEFIFQNFTCNLTWKPKNRLNRMLNQEERKTRDLHDKSRRIYLFSIEAQGNVTIYCNIKFSNPFDHQKSLDKSIKLGKINL
jgi:hypothetical protein